MPLSLIFNSTDEMHALLSGVAARRKELAKAHAACMKADAIAAAEKIHEKMRMLDTLGERLKELIENN